MNASNGRREGRRVVVTGMGALTSLGSEVDTMWEAMLAGRSGVGQIKQFDSEKFPVRIGSEVDLESIELPHVEEIRSLLSRSAQFGVWATERAWEAAGLRDDEIDPWRAGVCVGASSFPVLHGDLATPDFLLEGEHYNVQHYIELCQEHPELLIQRDMGLISSLLALHHPLRGVNMTVQTACASATQAIGEAYHMVRRGQADFMISGGTDSMLSAVCVTGFTLLGVASFWQGPPEQACRPFDRKRDGLVMGEGAGIVVVEELEHALARGATIHGEIVGYGSSCDGYRFTDLHPEGLGPINCMRAALADAGLPVEAVDYINAHGTATPLNDRIETLAIKQVFGEHAYRMPISSSKSMIGHLLCAAGAIGFIASIMAINSGMVPPTINLENPDYDCDLDYVPNQARPAHVEIALSNAFGFGGQNGSVIVRRWRDDSV
ncbi:MAG: beta-ketoacyl-[acyl-carrier-protein] synthase family protein [Chloroflexota bacterium]|nr:beta-ketoacyl-[acyl-carrier-protein] synthase family protein [Chloroflexota bacterium]